MTAIGFFLTGVVLLVVDLGGSTGKKEIREASYDHAMWMGICQGLSVFPGISRCGLTVSTGLFCGLSMRFAVKLSYLMSVPAVLGAFVSRLGDFSSPALHADTVVSCIVGMIAAAVTGYYAIRFVMKKLRQIRFRYFAVYCFLAGILTLIGNFM
jgi:undecaprenyl-diphosphatase